jgi:hypothetical protein
MGLFSGAAARGLFESLLRQGGAKRKGGLPSTYANLGFQRHYEIFGKELLFTRISNCSRRAVCRYFG